MSYNAERILQIFKLNTPKFNENVENLIVSLY